MGLLCGCSRRYMELIEVMMAYSADLYELSDSIKAMKTSLDRIEKHIKKECKTNGFIKRMPEEGVDG